MHAAATMAGGLHASARVHYSPRLHARTLSVAQTWLLLRDVMMGGVNTAALQFRPPPPPLMRMARVTVVEAEVPANSLSSSRVTVPVRDHHAGT